MDRPPPKSTLFPYTTLFRSLPDPAEVAKNVVEVLGLIAVPGAEQPRRARGGDGLDARILGRVVGRDLPDLRETAERVRDAEPDRKSTRLNSSHANISYAVFC